MNDIFGRQSTGMENNRVPQTPFYRNPDKAMPDTAKMIANLKNGNSFANDLVIQETEPGFPFLDQCVGPVIRRG